MNSSPQPKPQQSLQNPRNYDDSAVIIEENGGKEGEGSDDRYRVLVEFAHRHLDFLMAELESVLALNGIRLVVLREDSPCGAAAKVRNGSDNQVRDVHYENDDDGTHCCYLEQLLHQDQYDALVRERSTQDPLQARARRPFALLSFALSSPWVPPHCRRTIVPEHGTKKKNFTVATNTTAARSITTTTTTTTTTTSSSKHKSIGHVLLERCALVRSVIELWAMAPTIEACANAVQNWTNSNDLGRPIYAYHTETSGTHNESNNNNDKGNTNNHSSSSSASWKLSIHTLGTTYTREEQGEMRRQFAFLQFPGPVQLKQPDQEYLLIREVELDVQGGPMFPRHDFSKRLVAAHDNRPPLCCYFGRVLEGVRSVKGRGRIQEFSLKQRAYLGPTSMDAELAFVMANLAQVQKGSLVLDPFVGTGSILIACALNGAYCMGTDIDIRVLRGKNDNNSNNNQNVWSNFRQYDLPRPELIRSDHALYHSHFRSSLPSTAKQEQQHQQQQQQQEQQHQQPQQQHALYYDAICCDPPYGIRAGARQTGARRRRRPSDTSSSLSPVAVGVRPLTDEERKDHIPQTKPYPVSNVMADLLDMAARTLVLGGRLVYIIPSFADFEPDEDLPQHACLRTVHICYQPLSLELGRRLVAMEKVQEYDENRQDEYRAQVWKNGQVSAEKVVAIRAKINEAARAKPGYEQKLAIRKQKRKQNKEMKKRAKLEGSEQKSQGA